MDPDWVERVDRCRVRRADQHHQWEGRVAEPPGAQDGDHPGGVVVAQAGRDAVARPEPELASGRKRPGGHKRQVSDGWHCRGTEHGAPNGGRGGPDA
ncbi:hypothetical protein DVS28_b0336 (plasmid) [Euzebya pacifica]|uniref:Uncharacterized protein n=1 Tax=Euzebya pacifica TaxID=1608957 RepID=A0A346Y6K9_9ACTN|nr:hypothetical protein DVS28_b0336 [Euzebya pacifica]